MSTLYGRSYLDKCISIPNNALGSSCHSPRQTSRELGAKLELSPGQKVEVSMSPLRKTAFRSDLVVAPAPRRKSVGRTEVAKPADVDWLSGVASSLKREAEELKERNAKLESQISVAQDISLSTNGGLGSISELSTAAGASQGAHCSSQGFSWSRLSLPTEDRFSEERRTLRTRVSILEEEQRRLEMEKIRRLANIGSKAASSSHEAPSAVAILQELDVLTKQVDEGMVVCRNMERVAADKENALVRARNELEEHLRFDSAEGSRLTAEAQCLRENLRSNRSDLESASQKIREAEIASRRALTSASTLRSDCKILAGTREALLLEDITIRERYAAVSRSRLQTNSAIADSRECHARNIDQAKADVQEAIREKDKFEESDKDVHAKLLQLSQTSYDLPKMRKDLDELTRTHAELGKLDGRAARRGKLQTVEKECNDAVTRNVECRTRLSIALNSLQELRSSYAARLHALKEIAAANSLEHARYPDVYANMQRIRTEMTTHAEALACRLKEERAYGDKLWKEMSAISEAARLTRTHAPRRSRAVKGRENVEPVPNSALNSGAGSAAAWNISKRRSLSR